MAPFRMQREIMKEVQTDVAKGHANVDSNMALARLFGLIKSVKVMAGVDRNAPRLRRAPHVYGSIILGIRTIPCQATVSHIYRLACAPFT